MDPLSDVLSLLKVRVYACRGFQAGSNWSVSFGPFSGIKLFAVISGEGWLAIGEEEAPIRVRGGDCVLLPSGRAYRIASDLSLPTVDGNYVLHSLLPDEVAQFGEGNECFGVAGHFDMAGENADLLLSMLPPVVHIHEESDKQTLRWCLDQIRKEFQDPQPGASLVVQQLGTLMLVQILRTHLTSRGKSNSGWIFALADKRVSMALQAIHRVPSQHWTLNALARQAGMSRTGFAVRFKQLVGAAPLNYLARWRISLAKERILNSNDSIGTIATQVGYKSETAFSTAFRRVVGCAPRRYGRDLEVDITAKGGVQQLS